MIQYVTTQAQIDTAQKLDDEDAGIPVRGVNMGRGRHAPIDPDAKRGWGWTLHLRLPEADGYPIDEDRQKEIADAKKIPPTSQTEKEKELASLDPKPAAVVAPTPIVTP